MKCPSIDSFFFFSFGFTFLTLNRLAIYLNRRYQSIYSQGAGTKDALSSEKLRKLNVVSPIRRLDQWWPGVKDTLGLQGGVDNNHFVWYACPYLQHVSFLRSSKPQKHHLGLLVYLLIRPSVQPQQANLMLEQRCVSRTRSTVPPNP